MLFQFELLWKKKDWIILIFAVSPVTVRDHSKFGNPFFFREFEQGEQIQGFQKNISILALVNYQNWVAASSP